MAAECRQLQELGWSGKNKGKGKGKDNNDKDGDGNLYLGFQQSKGQIASSLLESHLHHRSAQESWLFRTSWQENLQRQSTLICLSTQSNSLEKVNGLA
jgi:hypothetical protein